MPGAEQRHVAAVAAKDFGAADILAFGEQHLRLKTVKAHFQHFLGFVAALLVGFGAGDHDDEPEIVLQRRADQVKAGIRGFAGLEAVGADAHAEQRIAVLLADIVPGEVARGKKGKKCG